MLGATCALLLLAPSCTSGGRPADVVRSNETQRGGTLRLAIVPEPRLEGSGFLDPQQPFDVYSFDMELFRCCLLRTLLSYNGRPIEEGGAILRPDIAAEMPQVSRDGLTWTFRLKEGLRYAPPLEDTEITSADIVRGIQRSARAEVADDAYGRYYSVIEGFDAYAVGAADSIAGLEVLDEHMLRVRLKEVTNDLGYRMALAASAPIPPNPIDRTTPFGAAHGHDDGYGPYLIASGPYMLEGAGRLDPSEQPTEQAPFAGLGPDGFTLVRNPSWVPSGDDLRPAYVDRMEFVVMPREDAERAVDESEIDLIFNATNSREQVERYLADDELSARVISSPADFAVGFAAMNLAIPPFDDVHVRRAVNLAYDADRWVGISNEATNEAGYFPFRAFGHVAPDGIESGMLRGYDPYPFDIDAARKEMALSTYDRDGDGVCDHPSCDQVFTVNTDFGFERQSEQVWIDGLMAIGITLRIEHIANLFRYLELSADPSRKIALNLGTYWFADYPNATTFFIDHFRADGIAAVPFGNVSLVGARPEQLKRWGYQVTSVPDVNDKIDECVSLIGFAQSRCWAELDQLLMIEVVPWVPQNAIDLVGIVSDRVLKFSVDEATGAVGWWAPDQIALTRGSV